MFDECCWIVVNTNSQSPAWTLALEFASERVMPTLLFVDDEPGIRETLPKILEMHGFETTAVGTVAEALRQITTKRFDILISDLNIGEPGDGFTVVSAMRRFQPECHTFILTGFPAFETALKAIRAQVDDYIIKPASIPSLLVAIEQKLNGPVQRQAIGGKRLGAVLRENIQNIADKTLANMKAEPKMNRVPLNDEQRIDHIPPMIEAIANMLDSEQPERTEPEALYAARQHGESRFQQGFSIGMLITGARLFIRAVNDLIQESLLSVDLSHLMIDLKWLDESVTLQLEEATQAYLRVEREKGSMIR